MMQVTGEEGITLEDYVTWQEVRTPWTWPTSNRTPSTRSTPACRARGNWESLRLIKSLIDREYGFKDRDAAREFFTKVDRAVQELEL